MVEENKPKKKSKLWKGLVRVLLILVILTAGAYYMLYSRQKAQEKVLSQLVTVPFARETLTTSVSGTGSVRPDQNAILTWATSGTVGNASFQVGDPVKKDTILLSLDQNKLPLDILQARMDKLTAEQALTDLDTNTVLQRSKLSADISNAQTQLRSLQDQLHLLQERNCVEWRVKDLQDKYDSALKTYQDWPTETQLAKLNAAKADLDFCNPETISQQKDDLQSQIDLQNKTISDWQTQLDKIKDGPNPDDRQKLELQLQIADKRLSAQQILAPFDGVITSIFTRQGDLVNPGMNAIELSDLSALYVDVPISEVDIPSVKIGQTTQFVFDAFFDKTFTGKVTDVANVGNDLGGVVNYTVTIKLDDGQDVIKPGMTAGVTILVEEKPNVLVVPSEAVATRNGKEVVYVLRSNSPVAVEVQIGSYSNQKVEIKSADIKEGELIILNPPTNILDAMQARRFGQ